MKLKIVLIIVSLLLLNCKQEREEEVGKITHITNEEVTGGFDRQKFPILHDAVILKENNAFEKAIVKFNEAESVYGPSVSIYLNRGVTYFRLGKSEKSIADFSKCLSIDSEYYSALMNRGIAYVHTYQYDKAIADLDKAILIKPKEPTAYLNRSIAHNKNENYELSCNDLKTAKALGLIKTYGIGIVPNYLKLHCEM